MNIQYTMNKEAGAQHNTVNHGNGEYARDEDVDGLCEVHVKPPLDFFEFIYNAKRQGKAVLPSLLSVLLA
jgi:hypothetical protein